MVLDQGEVFQLLTLMENLSRSENFSESLSKDFEIQWGMIITLKQLSYMYVQYLPSFDLTYNACKVNSVTGCTFDQPICFDQHVQYSMSSEGQ